MIGFLGILMGMVFVMYCNVDFDKKVRYKLMYFLVVLVVFLIGVIELLEFMFMFVVVLLYVIYLVI